MKAKIFESFIKVFGILENGWVAPINNNIFILGTRVLKLDHPELSGLCFILGGGHGEI